MRYGWLLLAGAIACSESADSPDAGDQPTMEQESGAQAVVPTSLADLAPGDTAGLLALVRHTINDGNALADLAEQRDTVMPLEGYREPRRLTLWVRNDIPVKLTATEPNDAGLMRGETLIWFVNGEIRAVQEPFDVLYFEADRLVLWTDEAMEPVAVPETDRMTKERAVIDSAKVRLAKFGLGYP